MLQFHGPKTHECGRWTLRNNHIHSSRGLDPHGYGELMESLILRRRNYKCELSVPAQPSSTFPYVPVQASSPVPWSHMRQRGGREVSTRLQSL